MLPHVKGTLTGLVCQVIQQPVASRQYRKRYLLYAFYYTYWALFSVRCFTGSVALRYSTLKAYFTYDSTMALFREVSNGSADFLLVFCFVSPYMILVHRTVNYRPHPLIWSYMEDALVRNEDLFKAENGGLLFQFRLNVSLSEILHSPFKWVKNSLRKMTLKMIQRVKGDTIQLKAKLRYFPHASIGARNRALLFALFFEAISRMIYFIIMGDFISRFGVIYQTFRENLFLFTINLFDVSTFGLCTIIFSQTCVYHLSIATQASILFSSEYAYLNRLLTLAASPGGERSKVKPIWAKSALLKYCREHSRLTGFILTGSRHILVPNMLSFLAVCLLTSSYMILVLYFTEVAPFYGNVFKAFLISEAFACTCFMYAFILVNRYIVASVPSLWTILQQQQKRWRQPKYPSAFWKRLGVHWKLLTYYELLRNTHGKELAISAGAYGALCRRTILQFFGLYLAYFLTFANAYQKELAQKEEAK